MVLAHAARSDSFFPFPVSGILCRRARGQNNNAGAFMTVSIVLAAPTAQARAQRLFVILTGIFLTNALIAEFVGVKIFALEPTLGIQSWNWSLFGQSGSLS